MADKSKIEWTDATWNPIRGCSVVSEGCRNCYAMQVAARFSGKDQAYEGLAYRNESGAHWTGEVRLIEERLEDPLRWKRPRLIFVNSMSDLFHESIPDEWIDKIFAVMALADWHQFQVLTKRPERMRDYLSDSSCQLKVWNAAFYQVTQYARRDELARRHQANRDGLEARWPIPNVWLGVSCEDQKTANERIPLLLETPAAVRWLSAEPLLGQIGLMHYHKEEGSGAYSVWLDYLDWVVVGGESGAGARAMHPDWARSLRHQCTGANVPFFFKQWGEWLSTDDKGVEGIRWSSDGSLFEELSSDSPIQLDPQHLAFRIGKKAAGRTLDCREWNQYPDIAMGGA